MTYLFLSYSHTDAELAKRIVQQLEAAGLTVWVDYKSIPPGADWELQIKNGIQDCSAMLLVQTPRSENSSHVKKERLYAESLKKPIYPLLCEGDVWFSYIDVQFTDLRTEFEIPLARLVASLPRYLPLDTINTRTATKVVHLEEKLRHDGTLNQVIFSPSGALLGAVGGGGFVGVWKLKEVFPHENTNYWFPAPFGKNAQSLDFNADDKYLVVSTYNQPDAAGIKIYDLENLRELQALRESSNIAHVALTQDRQILLAAESGIKPQIFIYRLNARPVTSPFRKNISDLSIDFQLEDIIQNDTKGAIRDLAVSPQNNVFATCGRVPNGLRLWTLPQGRLRDDFQFESAASSIVAMSFQADGRLIITSSIGTVWQLDPNSYQATYELAPLIASRTSIRSIALNPTCDLLALGTESDGLAEIQLWDLVRREKRHTLVKHTNTVSSLAFSPDGKLLASTGLDGSLHLWGLKSETTS